jgi:hypothetical protein
VRGPTGDGAQHISLDDAGLGTHSIGAEVEMDILAASLNHFI